MVEPVTAAVIGGGLVLATIAVLYGSYLKGRVDKGNEWDTVSYNDVIQYNALESEVNGDEDN